MTSDLKTEDSILSTVLQSVIRTLIVSVIAFSGLALTEHIPTDPLMSELSAPLIIFPYILYELLATLWRHAKELIRRLLALGAISVVGVWIYLFREIGVISLGTVLVITIAIDLIPVQSILDSVVARFSKALQGGGKEFESSTDNNPDTCLFPLDNHEQGGNFSEESSATNCPDCGCDLSRLLVGRYCPNCGNILESQNGE